MVLILGQPILGINGSLAMDNDDDDMFCLEIELVIVRRRRPLRTGSDHVTSLLIELSEAAGLSFRVSDPPIATVREY